MSLITAASVATVQMLKDELGSDEALANLTPSSDADAPTKAIQAALDDVVYMLKNRVPPVLERDLRDVTELKIPVVYGALMRLFRQNITTGDEKDVNARRARDYQAMYDQRVATLRPTLISCEIASPATIAFHRR
jgi:hypothetical protein